MSRSTVTVGATGYTQSAFESAARSFDRYLSIRWGETINQWVIERRAYIPNEEKHYLARREARVLRFSKELKRPEKERDSLTKMWMQIREENISAKRDRRVILFARWLTTEIFDQLVAADIKRYGGYSRFADELERREAVEEKEDHRIILNESESAHKEAFDNMNFLLRKRSAAMYQGERSLARLLEGRGQ